MIEYIKQNWIHIGLSFSWIVTMWGIDSIFFDASSTVGTIDYPTALSKYFQYRDLYINQKTIIANLKYQNEQFVLEGVKALEVIRTKEIDIKRLTELLNQFQNELIQADELRNSMTDTMEAYKNRIVEFSKWKFEVEKKYKELFLENKRLVSENANLWKKINLLELEIKNLKKD